MATNRVVLLLNDEDLDGLEDVITILDNRAEAREYEDEGANELLRTFVSLRERIFVELGKPETA